MKNKTLIDIIIKEVFSKAKEDKAVILRRFFKTRKGEYGEGDKFIGVIVPELRAISKKYYKEVSIEDIQELLKNEIHEIRLTALFLFVLKYQHLKDNKEKKGYFDFYLKNTRYINNWDLVDLSCYKTVGEYLLNNKEERKILYNLIESKNLWERRIAIIATFAFINNKEYKDTFKLIEYVIEDEEDLIQKVSGWMLREIGKKIGEEVEEIFLKKYYKKMPRTMLRYSLEHFNKEKKDFYMGR